MSGLEMDLNKRKDNNSFPLRVFDYQQLLIKYLNYVVLNNELMKVNSELNILIKKLKRQCSRDGQTGLYNYRHLRQRLNIEFKRARRYREPLTCIMLDVDRFKSINDTYGHRFGDFVLKKLGYMLRYPLRETDIVARYGGDEFGILVPNTGYPGAFTIAQKIQERITSYPFRYNGTGTFITISLGMASIPDDQVYSPGQLIDFADRALYQVKKNGGNAILGFHELGKSQETVPPYPGAETDLQRR